MTEQQKQVAPRWSVCSSGGGRLQDRHITQKLLGYCLRDLVNYSNNCHWWCGSVSKTLHQSQHSAPYTSQTQAVNINNEQHRLLRLAWCVFQVVAVSHKCKWLSGLQSERCRQADGFASIASQWETSVNKRRALNTIDCVLWQLCFDWFCYKSTERSMNDFFKAINSNISRKMSVNKNYLNMTFITGI